MPQNWKTYKLGEIVHIKNGKSKPKDSGDIPIYGGNGILGYSSKSNVDGEVILIGRVGAYCGAVYYENREIWVSDNCLFATSEEGFDSAFVYYLLKYANLNRYSTGSSQPLLTQGALNVLDFTIPESLPEQRAIASILSSLDDKIELNLQMNKTLEEMAMTIYKHWFVDFEFPSSGGVRAAGGGKFPSSGGVAAGRGGRNTTNYMALPYNPKLKERAKELRKAGNLAEVLFWKQVHRKKFLGLDFDRQKIIGNYIVDFYCANVQVVVEIDGSSHDNKEEYDAARDAYLEGLGLTVIHITDEAVKKDLAQTMEDLKNHPAFQGVVNSPPQEEYPQEEVVNNHPAFQAPLQRRGNKGYKSSGGKFIDSPLGPIPEGWEVVELKDVCRVINGRAYKNTEFLTQGTPIIRIQNLSGGGKTVYSDLQLNDDKYVETGDLIYAWSATFGPYLWHGPKSIYHYHIWKLDMLSDQMSKYYLFHHLDRVSSQMKEHGTGSIFTHLTKGTMESQKLILPSKEVMNKFTQEVKRLSDMVFNNKDENQTLTALRDTLLPKLISGEVRVKDVEQIVAEVL